LPSRSEVNASNRPSGDQEGPKLLPFAAVRLRDGPPPAGVSQTSHPTVSPLRRVFSLPDALSSVATRRLGSHTTDATSWESGENAAMTP